MREAVNTMPAWMGEGKQGDLKISIHKGLLASAGRGKNTPAVVNLFKLIILGLFQLFDPVVFSAT